MKKGNWQGQGNPATDGQDDMGLQRDEHRLWDCYKRLFSLELLPSGWGLQVES